jgi:hypothetical protein
MKSGPYARTCTDQIGSLIPRIPGGGGEGAAISLNKKQALDISATLAQCGICGGDLLHVILPGASTPKPSTPSSARTRSAAAAAGGGGGGGGVQDRQGRVWEESVELHSGLGAAARSRGGAKQAPQLAPGTAEEEREKRLRAISKRLGRGAPSPAVTAKQSAARAPGAGDRGASGAAEDEAGDEAPLAVHTAVEGAGAGRAEACLAGVLAALAAEGFPPGREQPGWTGGAGARQARVWARVGGADSAVELRAVEVMGSVVVHAAVGAGGARAALTLLPGQLLEGAGGGAGWALREQGAPLVCAVRTGLVEALRRAGAVRCPGPVHPAAALSPG